MSNLLEISNLHAGVEGKEILKGLNLSIPEGEVHVIMGPNGSGKSTLANVIMGHPAYEVASGHIEFGGEDLLDLATDERARVGVFLSFQSPTALPGISLLQLLRKATTMVLGDEAPDTAMEMMTEVNEARELTGLPEHLLTRSANDGFSGGEKKKGEIIQMAMLKPKLVILDEIDSGLDIDAVKAVSRGINALREQGRSFLIITHYQRILNYVKPDRVHVVSDGQIIRSGDHTLAHELEEVGYEQVEVAR